MASTDALQILKNAFAGGKPLHAYIVECDAATAPSLLKECAKIAMCPNFGGDGCNVCKKISADEHADLISLPLDKGKNKMSVEDVQYLVAESMKRPVDSGESRVFTIDATSSVRGAGSIPWQNKLLKTLEEPLPGVYIFIAATSADSLLPTVVSRSQVLKKKVDSAKNVAEKLIEEGFKSREAHYAAAISGEYDKARKILTDESYFRAGDIARRMLTQMLSTKDALPYVAEICSDRQLLPKVLAALTLYLRESIVFRVAESCCQLPDEKEIVFNICANYSIAAAECCIEKFNECKKRLDADGDVTVEADRLAIEMSEVRYRCRI